MQRMTISREFGSGGRDLVLMVVFGVVLTVLAQATAPPLSKILAGYDAELLDIIVYGFRLFSLSFLITGFTTFASAFFTALNNSFVSAPLFFPRMLLFQALTVLPLPLLFDIEGIWLAVTVAEFMTLGVSAVFFTRKKRVHHCI